MVYPPFLDLLTESLLFVQSTSPQVTAWELLIRIPVRLKKSNTLPARFARFQISWRNFSHSSLVGNSIFGGWHRSCRTDSAGLSSKVKPRSSAYRKICLKVPK